MAGSRRLLVKVSVPIPCSSHHPLFPVPTHSNSSRCWWYMVLEPWLTTKGLNELAAAPFSHHITVLTKVMKISPASLKSSTYRCCFRPKAIASPRSTNRDHQTSQFKATHAAIHHSKGRNPTDQSDMEPGCYMDGRADFVRADLPCRLRDPAKLLALGAKSQDGIMADQ